MHLVTFERSSAHKTQDDAGTLGQAAMGFESLEPVRPGSRRLGAVLSAGSHAGWVVDLNRALAIKLAYDDVGAPEVDYRSNTVSEKRRLIACGQTMHPVRSKERLPAGAASVDSLVTADVAHVIGAL